MHSNPKAILGKLKQQYPQSAVFLRQSNPLQTLVATILSAQCTDARVNMVTKKLFTKYKTVDDYANSRPTEFENDIRSTGFFRAKTRHILATAKKIKNDFGGRVPDSMEQLITLPGVARKTANIVLSQGFGKLEGIAVDTHVKRVSFRLGLTKHSNPEKIEQDLMEMVPQKDWAWVSTSMIGLGRTICFARKPACTECFLKGVCPSAFSFEKRPGKPF